jgi:hypothetical protein
MNTHYCKVGTIRPNLNKTLNPAELKNKSVEKNSKKKVPFSKESE